MSKKNRYRYLKSFLFSMSGFGLMESIITVTIMSILMLVTNRTMIQSIKSTRLVQSTSSENDLGSNLGNTLYDGDLCKDAFKPGAFGVNSMGVGVLDMSVLPEINTEVDGNGNTYYVFDGYLEVVKIEMEATESPAKDPKKELVKRLFTIHYKLRNVDDRVNTKDNQDCTASNTNGCYSNSCNISYQLNSSGSDVVTCNILDCAGTQKPLALVLPCFTAEKTDDERLLVGCGTTQPSYYDPLIYSNASNSRPVIEANNTSGNATNITGFGYNTGEVVPFWISQLNRKTSISGTSHTFFGIQPAKDSVVEGSYHTFVGLNAIMGGTVKGVGNSFFGLGAGGGTTIEGNYNSFFGFGSGRGATISGASSSHNTFVGTFAGSRANISGGGEGNTFLDNFYDTDNPVHYDIGINNGDYNTFLGSHSGRRTTISGDKNTFIGYGSGYYLAVNDDNNINIANALIAKPANTPTLNSTAHTINDKEVKIAGVLLLCDKGGWDCIEASPIDHTHAQLHLPDITDEYGAVGADGKEGDFHICTDNSPNLPIECEKVSLERHDDFHNPLKVGTFQICAVGGSPCQEVAFADHGSNVNSETHNPGSAGSTKQYALDSHLAQHTADDLGISHSHSGYASSGHPHPHNTCVRYCPSCRSCSSSRTLKQNINPFNEYEKALKDIITTPLFTFEYKADRPDKQRMGIISEELPIHLQLFKDKEQTDSDSKEKISHPDWPSIYGTFWAAIKSLFAKFKSFKESITSGIEQLHIQKQTVLSSLSDSQKEFKEIEQQFTSKREEIARIKINLTSIQEEIDEAHRELQRLEKARERLGKD